MENDKRIAVLIDADNVSDKYLKFILDEISNHGTPTYKRIYGDWTKPQMSSWKNVLLNYSISPIQQYAYTTGKNATDAALIIDAMDILYSGSVEGFCIVSSDSDFTKLAARLRESGMYVLGMGEKPFRARQLMKWIYRRAVGDFESMTDLGKDFRQRLAAVAEIRAPEVILAQASADGTRKWLLRLESGQAIEMVFIPEPGRGTLCISSQVGCAMDCTFCSTAQQGFNRNLDVAEITGQARHRRFRYDAYVKLFEEEVRG